MNENIKSNNTEFKSNKQIKEMAKETMKHCKIDNQCGSCHWSTCNECLAEVFYNADYRKERQGEWKVRGLPRPRSCTINHLIICSSCGFDIEMLQGKRYKYCPNCGAKMVTPPKRG